MRRTCRPILAAMVLSMSIAPAAHAAKAPTGYQAASAALQWTELQRLDRQFWPTLPQFNTGLQPGSTAQANVAVSYLYVGKDRKRQGASVDSTIVVYADARAARRGYAEARKVADAGGTTVTGPKVPAAQYRYFTRDAEGFAVRTLRWRVGRVIGRITAVDAPSHPWSSAELARLFRDVAPRAAKLSAGRLRGPDAQTRERQAEVLPAAGLAPGREIGTIALPPEAWASQDSTGHPRAALRELVGSRVFGIDQRNWLVDDHPGVTVSVVWFGFARPMEAAGFVEDFVAETGKQGLDAGDTGPTAGFRNANGFYELQFAAGAQVGDVACWAPFETKPPKACERVVRDLAEGWYAQLSAP
ncbi:MAG TPA: hypothetical protein VFR97_03260 [Capillimicrobium sp.]|nr:hypothetical protein [Capillimicrobium sp.]